MRVTLIVALLLSSGTASAKEPKPTKESKEEKLKAERKAEKKAENHKEAEEHMKKALDLMGQGQFDDALVEFYSVEALEPSPQVTQHVAECLEAQGQTEQAVAAYKKYLTELPTAADAEATKKHIGEMEGTLHFLVGKKLKEEKKYPEALKEFETARKGKADPNILYEIGDTYDLVGDNPKAVVAYQEYLKAAPDSPQAGEIQGRISVLEGKKLSRPEPPKAPPKVVVRKPFYTSRLGLVTGIAGLAILGGGIACLALSGSASTDADTARTETAFYGAQDRGNLTSLLGTILTPIGAVAVVAAIVILYLHTRPIEQAAPPGINPKGEFVPQAWMPVPSRPLTASDSPTSPLVVGETY